jgi:hypothetical protein
MYAGAGARLDLAAARRLGQSWVVQRKIDGIYATVTTDRRGRIANAITRAGEVLGPGVLASYRGVTWAPDSVLACELELWTESARRTVEARGYAIAHAFDAIRVGGRDVSRESYRVRRDALMRAQVALELGGRDQPWTDDAQGDAHDAGTGRYCSRVPRGWRRVQIVEQLPAARFDVAWADWVEREGGEGLVAVNLDAQLGARGSKRKIKPTSEIDCVVVGFDSRAAQLWWTSAARSIIVSRSPNRALTVGEVVEVRHDGFTDAGLPKFARIARRRPDLAA